MLIAVEYKDGRIKEFDANAFTSNEAMVGPDRRAKNALTEFDLRLDRIEEDGLRLNIFWHDASREKGRVALDDTVDEQGRKVELKEAYRRAGVSIMIANKAVLGSISRIIVYRANQPVQVAWRQGTGDWLIKGSLFEAQRVLTYSDANTTSLNAQALIVYRYLEKANPLLSPEEICAVMGYPVEAYLEVKGDEESQVLDVVEVDDDRPAAPAPVPDDDDSEVAVPDPDGVVDAGSDGDGAEPSGAEASVSSDPYAALIDGLDDSDFADGSEEGE